MTNPRTRAAPHEQGVPLHTQKVVAAMIIDDDEDARMLLAMHLRKRGFSVVTAANGREALDLLDVIRPSVIFLDLCMPVMDGARFREEQRHHREWITIPTVVMTGSNEETMLDVAVEETLRKPVSAHEVLAIVRRHCDEPA